MEDLCISTKRLQLHPIHPKMAKEFNELILDSFDTLHPWLSFAQYPPSLEETKNAFRNVYDEFLNKTEFHMGIYLKQEQKYIGMAEAMKYIRDEKYPPTVNGIKPWDVGYWLHKNYVGYGYVTEAVNVLIKYLNEELNVKTFSLFAQIGNEKSIRVAERLNFKLFSTEEISFQREDWPEKILCKIFVLCL